MRYILSPVEKLRKVIKSCERAIEEYENSETRESIGSIHFAKDYLVAAECLIEVKMLEDE